MRKSIITLIPCILFLAGCSGESEAPGVFPAEAKDKVVFVNYWAEWCAPCRREIPELNRFQQAFADEVALFGVNFDGVQGETLERQELALGIDFPTLSSDPGPILGWPVPEGLPYTMVTDSRGKRLIRLAGEQTAETLRDALARFRQQAAEQS